MRRDGSSLETDLLARVDDGGPDPEQLLTLVHRLLERNAQLEHALTSRIVIEQAKGVLAERFGRSPEEAFELMRRAARNHRMLIRELAAAVVANGSTPREIEELRRP